AEAGAGGVEGGAQSSAVGDIAGERQRAATERGRDPLGGGAVAVEEDEGGAVPRKEPRRRGADRPAGAGDERHLPGERLRLALAELRLLKGPVFDIEEVRFRDRLEAADRLGGGHRLDRALGEVGGDRRVLGAAAEAEEAEPRDQGDPRHRIELAPAVREARILP